MYHSGQYADLSQDFVWTFLFTVSCHYCKVLCFFVLTNSCPFCTAESQRACLSWQCYLFIDLSSSEASFGNRRVFVYPPAPSNFVWISWHFLSRPFPSLITDNKIIHITKRNVKAKYKMQKQKKQQEEIQINFLGLYWRDAQKKKSYEQGN